MNTHGTHPASILLCVTVALSASCAGPAGGGRPPLPPLAVRPPGPVERVPELNRRRWEGPEDGRWDPVRADLAPAKWIWLASGRTLPNTFVLFRRELTLAAAPRRARGWIAADSRYRLTVNGRRVQWGPAPADPRWPDADPVDIGAFLAAGPNVLGFEVLYYGHGDGTWPLGRPGLLARFEIEQEDGRRETVATDGAWRACVDRAHPPGRPPRWFLRSLQEEFDARLHPHGWDAPGFAPDARWTPAAELPGRADRPAAADGYPDYLRDLGVDARACALRARQIPPLREVWVPAARLAASGRVAWRRDPADWFDFRTPGAFEVAREPAATEGPPGVWTLLATPDAASGVMAIFEFAEQGVGWPAFTIDAPAGTIVELMWQEAHDPANVAWLDSQFFNWSRFICREGENRFEAFDFESLRWLQLHVRNAARPVAVREIGLRRRLYPWARAARVRCGEPGLQRLVDACLNTLANSAQETLVDGMGRERQQYSGDCGHQLHAIRYAFGETRLPRRYLRTFSEGLTRDGYFLDCWPGTDRLVRLMERQVEGTPWGPLLDHGVGFAFDCWNHYLETGELEALREPWPRLARFAAYLEERRGPDGLLPVEETGVPAVWLDHQAFRRQRHKQCAFNLYAAAAYRRALAPLARALGEAAQAARYDALGADLEAAAVRAFWDPGRRLFVDNRPWLAEERESRLSDRALATAVLFDQCPGGDDAAAVDALAGQPRDMGLSYPANAGWRLRALARRGRIDVVLDELRGRWATLPSVRLNNTLQEDWEVAPDSPSQWSHCAVVPLYVLFMDVAGIRPLAPGFAHGVIRPQLGDIGPLDLTACTPQGDVRFRAEPDGRGHRVTIDVPPQGAWELAVPAAATPDLPELPTESPDGVRRFRLPAGRSLSFRLPAGGG